MKTALIILVVLVAVLVILGVSAQRLLAYMIPKIRELNAKHIAQLEESMANLDKIGIRQPAFAKRFAQHRREIVLLLEQLNVLRAALDVAEPQMATVFRQQREIKTGTAALRVSLDRLLEDVREAIAAGTLDGSDFHDLLNAPSPSDMRH